ncbi:motility protein A [Aquipuribacter nitratireducens]|uniref:Motility protein A n=1 Tax=Aquipuribacter nitratireducens TaxID=650104 RepID=A0ABW0GP51_9MICO
MDPMTLIGIALAFAAIFTSAILEGGNPMAMFFLPPMLLVFGGALGAGLAGNTLKDAPKFGKAAIKSLAGKAVQPDRSLGTVVQLAEQARREGLLGLEEAAAKVDDPFLKEALELAIDGTDPEDLQDVLMGRIEAKKAADKHGAKFFADLGAYAPTVGIIGTVLGLVHVLENLSEPETLGHLIAAAFLATLWGVLSANVLFLPMAARLKRLSELEVASMEVVLEGVLAIQAGSSPRVVARKLASLLPPGTAAPATGAKKAA